MYDIIKSVIKNGSYELTTMLKKIDTQWVQDSITEEQRTELIELARENANASNSLDLLTKVLDLDKRVKVLEENKVAESDETDEYPEYIVGKWYYAGDKLSFNDSNYECVAPDGTVCTWNPDEYPAYWNKIE